jgi:hypothetical protein
MIRNDDMPILLRRLEIFFALTICGNSVAYWALLRVDGKIKSALIVAGVTIFGIGWIVWWIACKFPQARFMGW